MSYELIMLLGFFGIVLFSLLPAPPAKPAEGSFRGRRRQRRSDGEVLDATRHGRATRRGEAIRRRSPGRAVA
jgi:hypothetical protein